MDERLHRLSQFFNALGNGIRLKILYLLHEHDRLNVTELSNSIERSGKSTSHHLSTLRAHGLLESETEGKYRIYWLKRPKLIGAALKLIDFFTRE